MKGSLRCLIVLMLSALLAVPALVSAEGEPGISEENLLEVGLGYRGTGVDGGGETLSPYENIDSGARAEFDLLYFFPWRASLGIEADYFGESYYRVWSDFNYRGDVSLHVGSSQFPHNREHAPVFGDVQAGIPSTDLNPGDRYGLDVNETAAALKVRIPNYPAHLNLGARRFRIDGSRQQVFEDWSCATKCHVVSRSRKVNTTTDQVTAGADAHVGLFDLSYAYRGTSFSDSEPNPEWRYDALGEVRQAGTWPVHTYPDVTAGSHFISVSTSNTGRLAATLAYQFGRRTNDDTDLSNTYGNGGGTLVWRPHQTVSLALRYCRRVRDEDAPEDVADIRTAGHLPVEYRLTEDNYWGVLNYYPFRGLQLSGSYAYKAVDRDEARAWNLPEESLNRTWKIAAKARPTRRVQVDLRYQRQNNDDPESTLVATTRTDRYAGLSVQPWNAVLLQASFHDTTADNDSSRISTPIQDQPTSRHSERQTMQTGLTVTFPQRLNMSLFYVMFKEDVSQNLLLGSEPVELVPFSGVPYHSRGDEVLLQGRWSPLDLLDMTAEASWLKADGHLNVYSPPYHDIDEFNRFDASQWRLGLGGDVRIGRGWSLMTRLGYAAYEDQASPENDEIVREITVMARKKW